MKNYSLLLLLICTLLPASLLGQGQDNLIITEFMASNDKTLADEDGDFEDWIEIFNAGTNVVNLNGWYLTDATNDLTRWRFPATNLPPNSFLIVFASNKDQKIPGRELHTSFQLNTSGEYLALVKPDGITIVSQYPFPYPVQVTDYSFGYSTSQTLTSLVPTGAVAKLLVPLNDSLGDTWSSPTFNDSSWTPVVTGVGFETDVPSTNSTPTSLADSTTEFSGTQGGNSWYYGYWDRKADADGNYDPTNEFVQFPRGTGNVLSTTNYWDGTRWNWPAPADPPWTEINSAGGHPTGANGSPTAAIHAIVRRWVSETNGMIRIFGTLACSSANGTSGDGTIGRIVVDGQEIYRRTVFGTSVGYSVAVQVQQGSFVDFIVDPGEGNNDFSDTTTFTASIRTLDTLRLVADSMQDWSSSGIQGEKNWQYGYFNYTTDVDKIYQASNFIVFPSAPGPWSGVNFWNGQSWHWFDGNPPWTDIGELTTTPSKVNGQTGDRADEHRPIRRWISEVAGSVIVDWHVSKKVLTGDGVTARLLVNGTQRDSITAAASDFVGSTRSVVLTGIQRGDAIDFIVEPGTDQIGDESFLNAVIYGQSSLSNAIATDFQVMRNINSSAYLRAPFTVADPLAFTKLTLKMKYDDGFIAFLNGVEIARANSPETPVWDSTATAEHADADALEFVSFDVNLDLLVAGNNVLAIQGLNRTVSDSDFLILPQLVGSTPSVNTNAGNYFAAPTPGSANGIGSTNLAPVLVDIAHTPNQPAHDQDLTVTARVVTPYQPLQTLRLFYRIMFGSESNLVMHDDGLHGDGLAGDSIYGAQIPHSAYTNGQMIRYYFVTTDTLNASGRTPAFVDPINSRQFFGTVVTDPSLTNGLPVFHLFLQNVTSADTDAGTRGAVFYLGELYDNIYINLHGQSTRGFPIKKAYDIDFTPEHHFRYEPGSSRVDDINLLSPYADKTHLRNILSYEMHRDSGLRAPYHYVVPVSIRTNSQFWGDWHIVENGDADYLKRIGRDPNGAFYKMYDTMANPATAEKKTRRNEDRSDLQAVITAAGQSGTALRNYVYDNVDVPQVINYLAAMALTHNRDCCHKNYYVYRDTEGDGEWEMFPWDVDLSFGRNWNPAPINYWDDGTFVNNPLFIGNNASLVNALIGDSNGGRLLEVRQMYLRRFRTLMDTLLQSTNTPAEELKIEKRIEDLYEVYAADAAMDLAKNGTWSHSGGGTPSTNPSSPGYVTMGQALDIMKTNYLMPRRALLFAKSSTISGAPLLPDAQPTNLVINFGPLDFNPSSGSQSQEYIQLINTNRIWVDISGWSITGAVTHTFQGGVVIPPSNSVMYLVANKKDFRSRTNEPRGGQGLFIEGPFEGQLSAWGETLYLVDDTGRLVQTNRYIGAPTDAQRNLRITEIMYHPPLPEPGSPYVEEDFEYIEFKNIGTNTLDLTGIRFREGVVFGFTGSAITSLAAGERLLVVKNIAAFTSRYGSGLPIAGEYAGSLDNNGETLRIDDRVGEKVLDFRYENEWYPITDGPGASLVIVNENASWDTWGLKESWRPSSKDAGSPGQNDPVPPPFITVLVNEVLANSEPPAKDAIELHNPTGVDAQIGGWFISDDPNHPKKFRIPVTTVPAFGFKVFTEDDFNPTNPPSATGFAFSSLGDEAYLFSGDGTNITGYMHGFRYAASESGISFGRYVISTGEEKFVAQSANTLGTTNVYPKVGPIVISEIMYHPPDSNGQDNSRDEYVELHNPTGSPVALFQAVETFNTWFIDGGIEYLFPPDVTMQPGEYVLVVNFDPADGPRAAEFRSRYGLSPSIRLFGPYDGKLDNSSDTVELYKPDLTLNGVVPYVLVEQVEYADLLPWPLSADGVGPSLQRLNNNQFSDDPINWSAALSPGAPYGGTPPVLTSQPVSRNGVIGSNVTFTASASGTAPLVYQWQLNSNNISGANGPTLTLQNVAPRDGGYYRVVIFNPAGSATSSNAFLRVLTPLRITRQPASTNQFVGNGSNVTFSVTALSSEPTIAYQWKFNGSAIPGANASSYTVTDVELADEGDYSVICDDGIVPVESARARLTPKVPLNIVQHPESAIVPVGANASLGVYVTGYPFPIGYRWRKNSSTTFHVLLNQSNHFLALNNVVLTNGGRYDVAVTNLASPSGRISTNNTFLTVVDPPTNQVATIGGNATFNVAVGIAPNFVVRYQWRFGSTILPNQTNTSLTISNVQSSSQGIYTVNVLTITNGMSADFSARLLLDGAPVITTQPESQSVAAGADVTFNVVATGANPLTYQWKLDGTDLPGQTSSTLQLLDVDSADEGSYTVLVSNGLGSELSEPAILSVVAPPALSEPTILPSGEFRLLLSGGLNKTYAIEGSEDLSAWTELKTVTTTNTSMPVIDNTATNSAWRFYRARLVP